MSVFFIVEFNDCTDPFFGVECSFSILSVFFFLVFGLKISIVGCDGVDVDVEVTLLLRLS